MTYKQIRDKLASGALDLKLLNYDCVAFADFGNEDGRAEFPNGKALFIKACEDGLAKRRTL